MVIRSRHPFVAVNCGQLKGAPALVHPASPVRRRGKKMTIEKPGMKLTFRVVQPEEIAQVKQEVKEAFFSGDEATINANFEDHEDGSSTTILGYEAGRLVGIVTIRWHSHYPLFRERQIPLIQNIEIRYEDRGRGLGNQMLERTEQEIARRSSRAGLVVGISEDYGPAQRLYTKRGFVPDGRGVCRQFTPLKIGDVVTVDHDLLLWLVKDVSSMAV
jgi:ribosomal protein S18 acetylase RimI-like enzyme